MIIVVDGNAMDAIKRADKELAGALHSFVEAFNSAKLATMQWSAMARILDGLANESHARHQAEAATERGDDPDKWNAQVLDWEQLTPMLVSSGAAGFEWQFKPVGQVPTSGVGRRTVGDGEFVDMMLIDGKEARGARYRPDDAALADPVNGPVQGSPAEVLAAILKWDAP